MSAPRVLRPLTPRQRAVARLLALGYTYNQIGATVEPHIRYEGVKQIVDLIAERIHWPEDWPATARQRVQRWAAENAEALRRAG